MEKELSGFLRMLQTPPCEYSRIYGEGSGVGPCRFAWWYKAQPVDVPRKYCFAVLSQVEPVDQLKSCKLDRVQLKFRGARNGKGVRDGTRSK